MHLCILNPTLQSSSDHAFQQAVCPMPEALPSIPSRTNQQGTDKTRAQTYLPSDSTALDYECITSHLATHPAPLQPSINNHSTFSWLQPSSWDHVDHS